MSATKRRSVVSHHGEYNCDIETYGHGFVGTPRLSLSVPALPLLAPAALERIRLRLHLSSRKRVEHVLFRDPGVLRLPLRTAISAVVIRANLAAAMSPEPTPSRNHALFLSFKFWNRLRILFL